MSDLLSTLQCIMLKAADELQSTEVPPRLVEHLRLRRLFQNPYPEYEDQVKYTAREYSYFCSRCKTPCHEDSLCGASGFSLLCIPQRVYLFTESHSETGGVSDVRVLESDIISKVGSKVDQEDAISDFCMRYNARRVKAILSPIYGIKWLPYAEDHFDLEKLI